MIPLNSERKLDVKDDNCFDIELKYEKLITKAKEYMKTINDYEHDINHMYDVVNYTKELINTIKLDINKEVCIISAYWHDVGRTKQNEGHEVLSAEMLKEQMIELGYDNKLINECYVAIENHKWNMVPKTLEGLIVKDADKLAWIGMGRWKSCLTNKQDLNEIIKLLPRLKQEILYFDESKNIYDRDIVKLVELLYQKEK